MTRHRTPSRRHHRLVALAAVVLMVAGASPSSAQTDAPPARTGPPAGPSGTGIPPVTNPPSGEVTRVIVELTTPTRSPTELTPGEEAAQQQEIAGTQATVEDEVAGTGSEVVATFDHVPGMAVEATAEGLDRLRSSPAVASIRPDGVVRPLLSESTTLVRADETWPDADGTGYSVAVLDTGVDGGHDFLDEKVVYEACFADDTIAGNEPTGDCPNGQNFQQAAGSAAPCLLGGCGHGTHVAGIAASDGDLAADGGSYPGVARGANIVAVQVFHDDNGRPLAYYSDIVEGLDAVYTIHDTYSVAAVNLSLGGDLFGEFCDQEVNPAVFQSVQLLRDAGIPTVVASGNDTASDALSFPACLSNVISVGSVNDAGTYQDEVAFNSNTAPFLRMLAPGHTITSAVPDPSAPRNDVASVFGTSLAAPHVAGAIAILRDAEIGDALPPGDRVDHLQGVLRASGTCVTDILNKIDYTRLDVRAAFDWTGPPSLFWDIDCNYWAGDAIDWLSNDPNGSASAPAPLAAGFPDGSFGPDLPITRAQDARMVHRLFAEPLPGGGYTHGFTDVPAWVKPAVNWMNWPGGPADPEPLMSGTGSTFLPDANITRAEKARQLYRAAGSPAIDGSCPATHGFSDVPLWVDEAVRWLTCPAHGPSGTTAIAVGYPGGTFRPNNAISRAETARMLQRFSDAGHAVI